MKIKEFMKITIVGAGYVGLSLSALLSRGNNVVLVDTDQDKTDQINKRIPPIEDKDIKKLFEKRDLNLNALRLRSRFSKSFFISLSSIGGILLLI